MALETGYFSRNRDRENESSESDVDDVLINRAFAIFSGPCIGYVTIYCLSRGCSNFSVIRNCDRRDAGVDRPLSRNTGVTRDTSFSP